MSLAEHSKPRIIDIALQAGVSTATVDRVLNKRPGVRDKTVAKVHEAMHLLALGHTRPKVEPTVYSDISISSVISGGSGFANEILSGELQNLARERGIRLTFDYARRLDPMAQLERLRLARESGTTGLILQPVDHPLIRQELAHFREAGIPVVTILTDLPGSPAIGYVGLDNRAAGRTAGLLMGRMTSRPGKVGIITGGALYRSHEEREIGFVTVLRQEFPHLDVMNSWVGQDDPMRNHTIVKDVLAREPDLVGLYSIGSGNRGIEKALIESGRQHDITFIAYNLTPLTRHALLDGTIDAVIHQDMALASRSAIDALLNQLNGVEPSIPEIPIEIILRENIR